MNLSTEQRAAVDDGAPHKRVIAPAGSGKTRLLVAQAVRWIADGAAPEQMVVITFTRRAGEELRKRIGQEQPGRLGYIGTVHGMAYTALSVACEGRFRLMPLTDEECEAVVEHVAAECRCISAVFPKVLKSICGETVGGMKPASMALVEQVRGYMLTHGLCHVGDLVRRFVRLLHQEPDLLLWLRGHVRSVLWDEYQDTTADQAELLGLMEPERSLVVGDPRQAIYQFAGASEDHLWAREASRHQLTTNYRSGSAIVETANGLQATAGASMVAFRTDPGITHRRFWGTDPTFATSELLVELVRDGLRPTVLARTNWEVARIRDLCAGAGLRVKAVSTDFDPWSREPWPSLYLAARHLCDPGCQWLASHVRRLGVTDTRLWGLCPEVDTAGALLTGLPIDWTMGTGNGEEKLDLTIRDFVGWYGRRDMSDLLEGTDDCDVVVMTAHASKGLEFDCVVLHDVGGLLGGKPGQDERNLLYVAASRARDVLVMVCREGWK